MERRVSDDRYREAIASPGSGGQSAAGAAVGQRLSPAGGVRIGGLDLSRPLGPSQRDLIWRAFLLHHVVIFGDQFLTREQQFAFTANFGSVEHGDKSASANKRRGVAHVITNFGADGLPADRSTSPVSNYRWHTDKAYHALPPMMTTLYAVELPSRGGDTEFANTAMAYTALPAEMQQRIAALRVVFRWGAGLVAGDPTALRRAAPEVEHPLVRTHPETGAKALYLGNHASHIAGLPAAEGDALLADLLAHATEPRFVYAHRWRSGDLVMWDNRCLLHRAVANYAIARERRVMHRTMLAGTPPF